MVNTKGAVTIVDSAVLRIHTLFQSTLIINIKMTFRSKGKLETGHGPSAWPINAAWVKFGKVLNAMIEIGNWLNTHPTEIVVIYFGNMLGNVAEGQKELRTILKTVFNGLDGNVGLNDYWQNYQEWPTLHQAKETNQRIFAIVRTKTKVSRFSRCLKTL